MKKITPANQIFLREDCKEKVSTANFPTAMGALDGRQM